MTDQLLTAAQVAEWLAVPESWVREATRAGKLPHLRLGRYIRYHPDAITTWLQERAHPAPPGLPARPRHAGR